MLTTSAALVVLSVPYAFCKRPAWLRMGNFFPRRASATAQSIAARIALPGQVRDTKNAVSGPSGCVAKPTPAKLRPDFSICQQDN